jgi:diacylglycerol kinase family enzyme
MLPAPEAKIDDGVLDICMVKPLSKIKILTLFPKLIKGTHGSIKEVSFYRGSRIRLKCREDISINIDGEVIRGNMAVFEIIPKGINVIIPG